MTFAQKYRVHEYETDAGFLARPSSVLRYLMETASLQGETTGPSHDELRKTGRAFYVSRMYLRLFRPVRRWDEVTAETWPCESRGVSFRRCFRLRRGEEILAEVDSVWALVDRINGKICRVTDLSGGYLEGPFDAPLGDGKSMHLVIPPDMPLTRAGTFFVGYPVVDANRHMNNCAYADLLCSFLPMEGKRVAECCLHFCAEAPEGEELTVLSAPDGNGGTLFRTLRKDGGVNLEARIVTAGAEQVTDRPECSPAQ